MSQLVPSLSEERFNGIMSCIEQNAKCGSFETTKPTVITVWFPDIANKILKSKTPANGYCIYRKRVVDYTVKSIIEQCEKIWNAGLFPIEIVQKEGAILYALPKEEVFSGMLTVSMQLAEESIPSIESFYL